MTLLESLYLILIAAYLWQIGRSFDIWYTYNMVPFEDAIHQSIYEIREQLVVFKPGKLAPGLIAGTEGRHFSFKSQAYIVTSIDYENSRVYVELYFE